MIRLSLLVFIIPIIVYSLLYPSESFSQENNEYETYDLKGNITDIAIDSDGNCLLVGRGYVNNKKIPMLTSFNVENGNKLWSIDYNRKDGKVKLDFAEKENIFISVNTIGTATVISEKGVRINEFSVPKGINSVEILGSKYVVTSQTDRKMIKAKNIMGRPNYITTKLEK